MIETIHNFTTSLFFKLRDKQMLEKEKDFPVSKKTYIGELEAMMTCHTKFLQEEFQERLNYYSKIGYCVEKYKERIFKKFEKKSQKPL